MNGTFLKTANNASLVNTALTGVAYAASIELRGGRQRLQRLPVYEDMHFMTHGRSGHRALMFYGYILTQMPDRSLRLPSSLAARSR